MATVEWDAPFFLAPFAPPAAFSPCTRSCPPQHASSLRAGVVQQREALQQLAARVARISEGAARVRRETNALLGSLVERRGRDDDG